MIKFTTKKDPKNTQSSITIAITADAEFIAPYKQAVLKRLKKDLKVAGFRPGSAPDAMAERELGSERVQAEVLEEVIMHAYAKAVREEKLETIASPSISLKKFVPYTELEFEATAPTMPEIAIDFKKISVTEEKAKVTSKEVDEMLENMQAQSAKKIAKKGAIANGDEIKFDFVGVREGKPVEGASASNHTLKVGEGSFIPGFEENLLGLKPDEKKTFTVTFPADYHAKDLAGKDVEFSVTIKEVLGVELPKLDDAWAKTIGPVKDLANLKADIEQSIVQNKQAELAKKYESDVLEAVVKAAKFEPAQSLVEAQAAELKKETEQNLQNSGLDLEKYLQLRKQSEEEFAKELQNEAAKRVKLGMVLRHITASEKLTATEEEITQEIAHMRETYTDPKMLEHLDHDHFRDDLRGHLLTQKAIAYLLAQTSKKQPTNK